MSRDSLIALNGRWRETGHPYAIGEGEAWSLRCPVCRDLVGTPDSLVAILGAALRHNQTHRELPTPNGQVPHPGGTA